MRDANRFRERVTVEDLPPPPMRHPIMAYASIVLAVAGFIGLVGWKVAQQARDVRAAELGGWAHRVATAGAVVPAMPPVEIPAAIVSTTGAAVDAPALTSSAAPVPVQSPRSAPRARPHRPAPRARPAQRHPTSPPADSSASDNPYDAP